MPDNPILYTSIQVATGTPHLPLEDKGIILKILSKSRLCIILTNTGTGTGRFTGILLATAMLAVGASTRAAHTAPTVEELANISYTGIHDHAVTLNDGHWAGTPFVAGGSSRPTVGLVKDFRLTGDLNSDGMEEAVVLLWENSGGSGTRIYIAVAGRRGGESVNLASALLGDRVQVRSGAIRNGKIEILVVQQGPDDPACCPTQTATRRWALAATGLTEAAAGFTGRLSLQDLGAQTWILTRLIRKEVTSEEPEITLVFDTRGISGSSGCNRYFAGLTSGNSTGEPLFTGPAVTTSLICQPEDMALENRYLDALGRVTKHGFLAGKLSLTWQKDRAIYTMLFKPGTTE